MSKLFEKLVLLFHKKEKYPPKIKVCWDFLAEILGDLRFLTDEEADQLGSLNDHDPKVLKEIIKEFIVPHYYFFSQKNQQKIKNSLIYYLATNSPKLDRVFPSRHINMDTPGKLFFDLVWKELYDSDLPVHIDVDNYIEDCSNQYIMSLFSNDDENDKTHHIDGEPSLANVIFRLRQDS